MKRLGPMVSELCILAALILCPSQIEVFESDLEKLRCDDEFHSNLRDHLLAHVNTDVDALHVSLRQVLGENALEKLLSQRHVAIVPCMRSPDDVEKVRATVLEEFAKLHASHGLNAEIADAVEDLTGVADEGLTWRLSQASKAAQRALRSGKEDENEVVVAKNGVKLDAEELRIRRASFDSIDFSRGGRTRD